MPRLHDALGVEFANALGAYAASVVELLAPRLAAALGAPEGAVAEAALAALGANCGHELPNVAAAATDAWVKFYGALPADFAPPWRRAYATHVVRLVAHRAAQESEIPNFKGSSLGHFPLVSADFWTNRLLSSSSRSTAEELASKRPHTLTLKSG